MALRTTLATSKAPHARMTPRSPPLTAKSCTVHAVTSGVRGTGGRGAEGAPRGSAFVAAEGGRKEARPSQAAPSKQCAVAGKLHRSPCSRASWRAPAARTRCV